MNPANFKHSQWTFVLLLLLTAAGLARAADTPASAGYVLGVDDVIEINVRSHNELDKIVTVLPNGKITYAEVGELQASGRTLTALAAEIQTELEKHLNNVFVAVSLKEMHSRRVRVVGAVKQAGAYDLKSNWRVMDIVAVAGGLAVKPSRINGRIIRDGGSVLPFDLAKADADPVGDANVPLQANDLILLDEQTVSNQVHVMGQVTKPGAFELTDGMNLLSLMSQAGGPTEKAALSQAYVLRGTSQMPINLYTVMAEGKSDETVTHFTLQPGDVVFLPPLEKHYSVMGQVIKPGNYLLPEKGDITVLDALNEAGGQRQEGDIRKAGILREENGKWAATPVNIEAMLKKADLAANKTLRAGDILYIPTHSKAGFSLQDILSPISALGVFGLHFGR